MSIQSAAELGGNAASAIKLLKIHNPSRYYDTQLIVREMISYKKKVFGDDGLKKVQEFGNQFICEGGCLILIGMCMPG